MKEAGINFLIKPANINEDFPDSLDPLKVAQHLAERKASALSNDSQSSIVVASDTTVLIESTILNKPEDHHDAIRMLELLSGKMHMVVTGVCILYKSEKISFTDITKVYFKPLSIEEITFYVDNFRPFDKAGAYGIQEWIGLIGIEKIEGSYFNVMGLPIHRVYETINKLMQMN